MIGSSHSTPIDSVTCPSGTVSLENVGCTCSTPIVAAVAAGGSVDAQYAEVSTQLVGVARREGEEQLGGIGVRLIHTPGHTPGSQCFLVENRLVSGDTLFLDGCGRTDLPGGDPEEIALDFVST